MKHNIHYGKMSIIVACCLFIMNACKPDIIDSELSEDATLGIPFKFVAFVNDQAELEIRVDQPKWQKPATIQSLLVETKSATAGIAVRQGEKHTTEKPKLTALKMAHEASLSLCKMDKTSVDLGVTGSGSCITMQVACTAKAAGTFDAANGGVCTCADGKKSTFKEFVGRGEVSGLCGQANEREEVASSTAIVGQLEKACNDPIVAGKFVPATASTPATCECGNSKKWSSADFLDKQNKFDVRWFKFNCFPSEFNGKLLCSDLGGTLVPGDENTGPSCICGKTTLLAFDFHHDDMFYAEDFIDQCKKYIAGIDPNLPPKTGSESTPSQ